MLSEKDEGVSGAVNFSTAHTLTHMASQDGGNVTSSLDLSRQFTSSGVSVPVEIVDASGHTTTVLEESTTEHSDLSQDERMEISIEEISQSGQSLAETLTVVGHTRNDKVKTGIEDIVLSDVTSGIVPSSVDSTQLTPRHISNTTLTLPGIQTNATPLSTRSVTPASLNLPTSLGIPIDGSLDPHLTIQQVSQSAIQHFQEALRNEGIEISPETIANHFPHSLAESLAASIVSHSSHPSNTTSILESAISQSAQSLSMDISYGDISDVSRVINDPNLTATSSNDQMGQRNEEIDTVLSEPHVPSSPESNFDTSELLNSALTQDVELTTKLASAGPVGVAAAAAIMSGRKRRKHVFESNPALRKRHCSKLLRRLRETLDELSTRVGLQACVVTYRPSSKQEKPEPAFKVFGTSPLNTAIEEQKYRILNIMDEQLKKQMPQTSSPQLSVKQASFDLPPLVFEGIPTPVHEMTQAQLRGFIPHMLKYATGRGKPGWGKDDMRPPWWPVEIPWQNVRSDVRDNVQKKAVSWTECLRKIITACYTYHGCVDLLQAFSHKPQEDDMVQGDESGHHLQLHLHDQHGIDLAALQENVSGQVGGGGDVSTLPEVTTTQDQSLMPDQQQVFTIDTGMGGCDTSGMPTLADASLAETAARLQQVADETGQVQYATQTVTVTEGDAKALGQPVGSTTTVLLTAYPSGQTVGDSQQYYQPSTTSASVTPSSATTTPSVQVVYSAAHVSELPEAIVSSIASSVQQELYGQNRVTSSETESDTNNHLSIGQTMPDSSEYFVTPSRATGDDDIMVTAGNDAINSGPVSLDLASQYISNYPSRQDSGILISASEQDATEKLANTSSSMVSSERNIDQGICLETRKNISKDLSANSTSL